MKRSRVGYKMLGVKKECKFCHKITELVWVFWLNYWSRCSYCLKSIERPSTTINDNSG